MRALAIKETVNQSFRVSGVGLRDRRKDLEKTTSSLLFPGTSSLRYVWYEQVRRLTEMVGHGPTSNPILNLLIISVLMATGRFCARQRRRPWPGFPMEAHLPRRSNAGSPSST